MIITDSSTGLYDLPVKPTDVGNITFTVSAGPPQSKIVFAVKLPIGIALRERAIPLRDQSVRRAAVGQLIYTNTGGGNVGRQDGTKQFEVGQVLEFEEEQTTGQVITQAETLDSIRHDLNVFDLDNVGLSTDNIAALNLIAATAFDTANIKLNDLTKQRAIVDAELNSIQKQLNEVSRTIGGIDALLAMSVSDADAAALNAMRAQLVDKQTALISEQEALITSGNDLASQITATINALRTSAALVR